MFLLSHSKLILAFLAMGMSFCPPLSYAQGDASDKSIYLSEILFLPQEATDSRWIELVNGSSEAVSIRGWCVADFNNNNYVIPGHLEPVPPNGVVVIYFAVSDSDREMEDDFSFQGDNVAALYCRESWSNAFISGWQNGCGLYKSDKKNTGELVDFVCWGRDNQSDSPIKRDAVENGYIHAQIGGVYVGNDIAPGDLPALVPGGTIGRLHISPQRYYSDWIVYKPIDRSPGAMNRHPAPIIDSPSKNSALDMYYGFKPFWIMWRDSTDIYGSVRIQVANDNDFQHILFDQWFDRVENGCQTDISHILFPGVFYCRVRFESSNETTNWSEVVNFRLFNSMATVKNWDQVEK